VVVQAGGESSRMGQDKALMTFLGRPLIERVVERVSPLGDEVLVTANDPSEYAFLGLPTYPDVRPGRGALGGLYTALRIANHPVVAVVACDMPFVNIELLAAARRRLTAEALDAVVPRTEHGFEPFHAVYRCDACVEAVERALDEGQWRLISWFGAVKLGELAAEVIQEYDPRQIAFWNVNTPDEFRRAEALAEENLST
jgi:molybdopterin-guanine dinucleotide biosynthesis protein A